MDRGWRENKAGILFKMVPGVSSWEVGCYSLEDFAGREGEHLCRAFYAGSVESGSQEVKLVACHGVNGA